MPRCRPSAHAETVPGCLPLSTYLPCSWTSNQTTVRRQPYISGAASDPKQGSACIIASCRLPPATHVPAVLLARDGSAKIADVGLARNLSKTFLTSPGIGTFAWCVGVCCGMVGCWERQRPAAQHMPACADAARLLPRRSSPEVLTGQPVATAADIYRCGCLSSHPMGCHTVRMRIAHAPHHAIPLPSWIPTPLPLHSTLQLWHRDLGGKPAVLVASPPGCMSQLCLRLARAWAGDRHPAAAGAPAPFPTAAEP